MSFWAVALAVCLGDILAFLLVLAYCALAVTVETKRPPWQQ